MPIFDYRCSACGAVRRDVFVRHWDDRIVCECKMAMDKIPSITVPRVFPAEGIFLEHVSAEGKRFFSKKEMQDYAKEHDLEIGYLD